MFRQPSTTKPRKVALSVTDEPARRFVREARIEGLLDEKYFVMFTRIDGGRYRKT
jgi:hypothetical protein